MGGENRTDASISDTGGWQFLLVFVSTVNLESNLDACTRGGRIQWGAKNVGTPGLNICYNESVYNQKQT